MAGKGKFIYIYEEDGDKRIVIKDSAFQAPEVAKYFPLSQFSTDDLLKVKAQIATNLENRMDLDEVTESNLEKLRAQIRGAKAETIAQLYRQTIDRLEVVAADEKRAKTRQAILEDELKYRMQEDNVSELKFAGLLSVAYKPETVYSVGEEGWTPVYSEIFAETLAGQLADGDTVHELAKENNLSNDEVQAVLKGLEEKARSGLNNTEAFAILQKRLTSTTLNELVKQGLELPKGIEQATVRKVKVRKLK
nr:MAG TPA: hypothetical protein [Caudoviricetes sp.]